MDIDGWLRGIGLSEYAEMFRANDINIELLGRLTNDDLKDIGVVSLGHRKKLLEAIAERAGAVSVSPRPAVSEIGLVSGDDAAMLLSSSWRPHGQSKIGSRNPLESRRVP